MRVSLERYLWFVAVDNQDAEGDVDLLSSDEYWDPHAIAGLLKSFLRELPASILTRELHLRFLSVIGMFLSS
jgi:RalA-binding protein 1